MKKFITLTALLLLLATVPRSLCQESWHSKVAFVAPATWALIKSDTNDRAASKLYFLRKDKIGLSEHPSNAVLQYYPVPASVTIAEADGIVATHLKGIPLILQAQDDSIWKTYLLSYREQGQQYVVLHRIGILDGVGVELMLSFPILDCKEGEPLAMLTLNKDYVHQEKMAGVYCCRSKVAEMVDGFNAACRTLKIANVGDYRADAQIINPPSKPEKIYRYKGNPNAEK